MNTSIQSNILRDAARLAGKVVSNHTTLPILSCVRLQAGTECLAVYATDLDTSVMVIAPAHTDTEGECCVASKRLTEIASSCKGPIELDRPEEEDKDSAPLRVLNGSTFSLATLPVEEFPPTPTLDKAEQFIITAADLRKGLSRVSASQSTDETRYVLNGVCFELTKEKGVLRCIATDGRRMSYQDVACSWLPDKDKPMEFIVPSGTIRFILPSLPKDKNTPVQVSFKDNHVSFMFRNGELGVLLTSKLIDGNFPNYKQVIPTPDSQKIHASFDRVLLLAALNQIEHHCTEKSNSVKMEFTKNNCKLTAGAPGESNAEIVVGSHHDGENVTSSFNPAYLIDALSSLDCDIIEIHMQDHLCPVTITAPGEQFKAVVMPMRMS